MVLKWQAGHRPEKFPREKHTNVVSIEEQELLEKTHNQIVWKEPRSDWVGEENSSHQEVKSWNEGQPKPLLNWQISHFFTNQRERSLLRWERPSCVLEIWPTYQE